MREILFRGKCVDTGNWYEGGYIHLHKTTHCPIGDPERFPDNDIHQIVFERMTDWELPNQHLRVDVNPETVGQFTGLTDKNGTKIFEGDVVKAQDDVFGSPFCNGITGKIIYDEAAFFIMPKDPMETQWLFNECAVYEVIGNIHDNPELVGGAEDVSEA